MGRKILLAAGIFTALTPIPGLAGEASQPGAGQTASDRGVLVAEASKAGRPHPTSVEPQQLAMEPVTEADAINALILENKELKARLERLEALVESQMAVQEGEEKPEAIETAFLPKNGIYVQGDLGGQWRQLAGESGTTYTEFDWGWQGSLGIGYRVNKNIRFSGEFAHLNNSADVVAAEATGPLPGVGDITLNQWTANLYYDLNGFGKDKRFRPYVGIGVGTQQSILNGISNTGAAGFGLFANGRTWAPLVTYEVGLGYLISKNLDAYVAAKYALGSELFFEDTDFGNLLPQSSRNFTLKTGLRYTF